MIGRGERAGKNRRAIIFLGRTVGRRFKSARDEVEAIERSEDTSSSIFHSQNECWRIKYTIYASSIQARFPLDIFSGKCYNSIAILRMNPHPHEKRLYFLSDGGRGA